MLYLDDRIRLEKEYWDKAALSPEVDTKYIADVGLTESKEAVGSLVGRVLEIGCGVGRLMEDGFCGIDISEGMLEIARKRKPECEFKICDGRTIPYPDNYFDSAYCMLVFQHLPLEAISAYINETFRVLTKDGIFRFQFIEGEENEPFSHHYKFSEIKRILVGAGFIYTKVDRKLVHPQWTWITATKG